MGENGLVSQTVRELGCGCECGRGVQQSVASVRAGPRVLNRNAGPERLSLHPTSAAGEDEAEKKDVTSVVQGDSRDLQVGRGVLVQPPEVGSFHPCNCGKGRCLITEHGAEIDRLDAVDCRQLRASYVSQKNDGTDYNIIGI